VLAVLGNVEIDLRDAVIGIGVSVIEAVGVLGNVEILVPPEIAVECDGDGILGSFTLKYQGRINTAAATSERTIRVTGTAYAASVSVTVKGPDEDILTKLWRGWA
jgi:predicted membrane protein